jgi:hypothetical protein
LNRPHGRGPQQEQDSANEPKKPAKAKEELRKQFVAVAEAIANRQQRSPSFMDLDQLPRLRQAIDALDHAMENHWERERPHQIPRPPEDDSRMEMQRNA